MRIQHNIMAMNAYRNYTNNSSALSKNLEKLSSGYKINRAGDDAAGLAISEKMRAQITGLSAAQKNVKDGISLVKTAEGAMQEIQDMLNRMDYLATQSANGTYQNEVDREALQKEVNQLREEINRIADSANFNGIKLLDGSLESGAKEISVKGVDSTQQIAVQGKYTNSAALTAAAGAANIGDTYEFSVSLSDGTSVTTKVTVEKYVDADGKESTTKVNLVGADGTILAKGLAKANGVTTAELDKAMLKELKKSSLADTFEVTSDNGGKFSFENLEAGDDGVAHVNAFDAKTTINGTATQKTMGVTEDTAAENAARKITAADITEYTGKNYDEAVFTINGHKFVLMTGQMDGSTTTDPAYMNAVAALGPDVTVLVGDSTTATNGLDPADGNWQQNADKIAEVTGLKVEKDGTTGIKLSLDPNAKSGLTLQIGDTADSYNQLKVSVGDMHTKALGIDKIDIGTQAGAQAAVDVVKAAINKVSSVRGDLGAYQNRLEHTQNNLSVMAENIQDAESTIRDTDVAEEMMSYVKNNILVQSAQAMLAQANQVPQGVLQLLG